MTHPIARPQRAEGTRPVAMIFRANSILMALVVVVLVAAGCGDPPATIYIKFPEKGAVERNMEVRIAGVNVGKVKNVDVARDGVGVEATVALKREYLGRVYSAPETIAVVKRDTGFFTESHIEIRNGGTLPLPEGGVITGTLREPGTLNATTKAALNLTVGEDATHLVETSVRSLVDFANSPDGARYKAELQNIIRDLDNATSAGLTVAAEQAFATAKTKVQGMMDGLPAIDREVAAGYLDTALTELQRAETAISGLTQNILVDAVRGTRKADPSTTPTATPQGS